MFKTRTFQDYPEFDNHEMLIAVSDEQSGLNGYIGIHSTLLGPALGGTRFQAYNSKEDALRDALNLSKAMSFKCALAGLPYGGGKGVIFVPKNSSLDKQAMLAAYARMVENLRGLFKTGTDVGISDDEVRHMAKYTAHMLGVTEADRGDLSTSSCAALGVFCSMKATLEVLYGSSDFTDRKISIKGVGKLGGELARLVQAAGGIVTVADINQDNIQKVTEMVPGVTVVSVDKIAALQTDIYAPCALGAEFTRANVKKLQCKSVVGGANNQLQDQTAGTELHRRGILYVPDYIANGGGLIYVADELEPGGFSQQRVVERVENIQHTVMDILTRSKQESLPTAEIADAIAKERIGLKV
jgi:glutamate dehydrogenase/leucine dehydrogenase